MIKILQVPSSSLVQTLLPQHLLVMQEVIYGMEMSQNNTLVVEANMYFLARDAKYIEEKPYTLRYSTDDGFPQTNIERTEYSIKFHDMRTESNLVYNKCGFRIADLQSQMKYEDYDDVKKIESIHQPEVAECVKQAMKASSAEVLDYVVSQKPLESVVRRPTSDRFYRYGEDMQLGPLLREKAMISNNQHQEPI
jgi:hypothetical protein